MSSFTEDADLGASAPRLWMALKDGPVLLPKIAPHFFASIENVQGADEEIGSVRLMKLGPVAPEGAYVKEKLTALDQTKFTVSTEEIEGGHLTQGFTRWAPTIKFIPVDDKSCKLAVTVEYEPEGANAGAIAQAKEGFGKLFKGLAGYIATSGAYA